ncbi:MAG: hypothetical protein CVV64_11440 [Candidatus Wallbacteria bacterium HGW-Wallbacteria-1]|jgi:hypothetical protein|uniref:ATP-grasp domain-containing protein n=1 Tax=Candidatus Wallbacteria bacterium HGW-Wallbacteria-1 TaxID=2013854 RepID=A0A2N1PNP4_9BACT|nr:MAG: hypothetical protein CVV64_11440 [Candidatus Wallbacteria bacterium HGW-Wallbacteria-1]
MTSSKVFTVGVIGYGLEREFGEDLIEGINWCEAVENPEGETVKLQAFPVPISEVYYRDRPPWDMVIDRSSYLYPFALGMFFHHLYQGVYFVNNPLTFEFWINHKFLTYSMINSLGIPVPETYLLPPHSQDGLSQDDIVHHKPFDWKRIEKDLKFPMVMKPNPGREANNVHFVHNMEELWRTYNGTGKEIMTLQQLVKTPDSWFVRCICVGRKIIPIKYKFGFNDMSSYIFEENFLEPEIGRKIIEYSKIINRALGLEMNSIEFMIDSSGTPWAIDFDNPVPDGRRSALGDIYYKDYQSALVQLVADVVRTGRKMEFMPSEVNKFNEIARSEAPVEEKFRKALELAELYYRD